MRASGHGHRGDAVRHGAVGRGVSEVGGGAVGGSAVILGRWDRGRRTELVGERVVLERRG